MFYGFVSDRVALKPTTATLFIISVTPGKVLLAQAYTHGNSTKQVANGNGN